MPTPYTVYLVPTGDGAGCTSTYGIGHINLNTYASSTPYWSYCDETSSSLNYYNGAAAVSRTSTTNKNPFWLEFIFEAPPAGHTISNLVLKCAARMSTQGPSYFSANPICNGFVDPAGTDYVYGSSFTVTQHCNRNQSQYTNYAFYTAGQWATNPATSLAWTLVDLSPTTFRAGVRHNATQGGVPDSYGGNTAVLDFPAVWIELTVTAINPGTDLVRQMLSRLLRRQRSSTRYVEITAHPNFEDVDIGDPIWVAHDLMPTEDGVGSDVVDWKRQALYLTGKEIDPLGKSVRLICEDGRDNYCTFWSPFRTDLGAADDWSGVARMDQGGGYECVRDQVGWLHRPNDFMYREAAADNWRITPWGLAICGGGTASTGENQYGPNYNTFSGGTGTTFTGWTKMEYTTTVAESDGYGFDVQGYRRGCKTGEGATPGTTYCYMRTTWAGFTSAYYFRGLWRFRPLTDGMTLDDVWVRLVRSSDSYYYNPATNGWASGTGWVSIQDIIDGGYGSVHEYGSGVYEAWTGIVNVGATATLTIDFGRTGLANSYVEWHMATLAQNRGATGNGTQVLRRTPLVTTSSNLNQLSDDVDLLNETDSRIWYSDHGTCTFVFTPMWDHADLPDSWKYLLTIAHDESNSDYETVYYLKSSGTAYLRFRRYRAGADLGYATYTMTGTDVWSYMEPHAISVRWIGTSGELGLANRTLDIFMDGVKGESTAVATNDCRYDGSTDESYIRIGRPWGASPDITNYADGYFADMEIRTDCLSDTQIAKLHGRIAQNLTLPTEQT